MHLECKAKLVGNKLAMTYENQFIIFVENAIHNVIIVEKLNKLALCAESQATMII